ncbi:tetratricopeptide repeat protein [Micromonospora sp. NPDC050686]|uniref:tetratricopeptide repeat protein n=1 Tax=Micromonospora sp. NPDC050686 TaxID=3154631 RepID=UPI0033E2EF70
MPSRLGELTRQAHQLVADGDLAGARQLLSDALADADPRPANATAELAEATGLQAKVLIALGEAHSARGWAAFTHAAATRLYGRSDERSITAAATLAAVLHRVGSDTRAARLYSDVILELTARDGPESPRVLAAHADLATVEYARGQCALARDRLLDAWELHREVYGDEHPSGIKMLARLGRMQRDCGRLAEARQSFALAEELARQHLGPDDPLTAQVAAVSRAAPDAIHVCADDVPPPPPEGRVVPAARVPPAAEGSPEPPAGEPDRLTHHPMAPDPLAPDPADRAPSGRAASQSPPHPFGYAPDSTPDPFGYAPGPTPDPFGDPPNPFGYASEPTPEPFGYASEPTPEPFGYASEPTPEPFGDRPGPTPDPVGPASAPVWSDASACPPAATPHPSVPTPRTPPDTDPVEPFDDGWWPPDELADPTGGRAAPPPGEPFRSGGLDDPPGVRTVRSYDEPQPPSSLLPVLPRPPEPPPPARNRMLPLVVGGVVVVLLGAAAVIAGVSRFDASGDTPPPPPRTSPAAPSTAPAATPRAAASPGTPPTKVTLRDRRDNIALDWTYPAGGEGPVLISAARAGQQPNIIERLPAGTESFIVYGLDRVNDFCFTVAVVWSTDTVATARPVCTRRR